SAFFLEEWRAKRQHVVERHSEECYGIDIEVVLTSKGEPVGGAGPALLSEDQAYKESVCRNQLTRKEINLLLEKSPETTSFDRTKLELKRKNVKVTPCNLASFCDEKASHLLMQLSEALRFLAVNPLSSHGLSSNIARVVAAILSHRNFVFQKSSGYNTHLRSRTRVHSQDGDRIVAHPMSGDGKANFETKAIRFCRPTNKQCRLNTSVDINNGNNAETINDQPRQSNKISPILGLSSMKGVSQAHANTQTDIDFLKLDVHELLLVAQKKKTDLMGRSPVDALQREAGESDPKRRDISEVLCGIRMGNNQSHRTKLCEVSANDFFSDGFGDKSESPCVQRANKSFASELHLEVRAAIEGAYGKKVSSDGLGDVLGSRCVLKTNEVSAPEHRLEVSSGTSVAEPLEDKGEAEQGSSMEPLKDTGVFHVSDTAVCSAGPQPTMTLSEDTGMDFSICSKNASVSSHQSLDNGTKSYLPVGIYMKFPSSFVLPSELQLNAIFARFGNLGTAGIRVFRETASAQVIFKHSNEAERAYKCVKEASPFGDASVVFRLQYFARV
ncbi:hypothetical protein GOP47_0004671, partial [Adiantum capillus-veneris]